eukprot:TRINITY_DN4076_c0_g1_i12.p1 TRINITY_DN4076_c0_g1~~TRINITY_DN4076_c0_g1_i12.p1  ORF type:complete len:307 (-),score=60.49 TRINITY_DN4076_c0_g1_i12:55-858(-)
MEEDEKKLNVIESDCVQKLQKLNAELEAEERRHKRLYASSKDIPDRNLNELMLLQSAAKEVEENIKTHVKAMQEIGVKLEDAEKSYSLAKEAKVASSKLHAIPFEDRLFDPKAPSTKSQVYEKEYLPLQQKAGIKIYANELSKIKKTTIQKTTTNPAVAKARSGSTNQNYKSTNPKAKVKIENKENITGKYKKFITKQKNESNSCKDNEMINYSTPEELSANILEEQAALDSYSFTLFMPEISKDRSVHNIASVSYTHLTLPTICSV